MIDKEQFNIERQDHVISLTINGQQITIVAENKPITSDYKSTIFTCQFISISIQEGQVSEILGKLIYELIRSDPNTITFEKEQFFITYNEGTIIRLATQQKEKAPFWGDSKGFNTQLVSFCGQITYYGYRYWWSKQTSRLPLPKDIKITIKFSNFIHLSSKGIGIGLIAQSQLQSEAINSTKQAGCISYWYEPACWQRQGREWNSSIWNQGQNQIGYFSIGLDKIQLIVTIDLKNKSIKWENGDVAHESKISERLSEQQLYFFVEMGNQGDWVSYQFI